MGADEEIDTADGMLRAQAAHFAALDPLLPAPVPHNGGEPIGALTAEGKPLLATLRSEFHRQGKLSSLWSARLSQQLYPLVADGTELEPLVRNWAALVADRTDEGEDSSCVLVWPSRDTAGSAVLLRHGLVPLTVLAVRAGQPPKSSAASRVRLRDATAEDLPALLRLSLAELSYAAEVGAAVLRPDAREMEQIALNWWLDSGMPALIAELEGEPVGMLQYRAATVDPDARPNLLRPGRWAYINCLSVLPTARSRGVGQALSWLAHARLHRLGVPYSYLYYNPANPLSSVFWPRQGYRPLWTVWEARPARALR